MKSRRGKSSEVAAYAKQLDDEEKLIESLLLGELRGNKRNGIYTDDKFSPPRIIERELAKCDADIRNEFKDQFDTLYQDKRTRSDGIVTRCIDANIAICVEKGIITNVREGRGYMIAMLKAMVDPAVQMNNDEAEPRASRDLKIKGYSERIKNNLENIIEIQSKIITPVKIVTSPDPKIREAILSSEIQRAMLSANLTFPEQTSFLNNIYACKMRFLQEALIKGSIPNEAIQQQYELLNKLLDACVNTLNSYQAIKSPNIEQLRVIAELANKLDAIISHPNLITSDNVAIINKNLFSNLCDTYDRIALAEPKKSGLSGFISRSSNNPALDTLDAELKKYEELKIPESERPLSNYNLLIYLKNIKETGGIRRLVDYHTPVANAIKNGEINSIADVDFYLATYKRIALKYFRDTEMVGTSLPSEMDNDLLHAEQILKIRAQLLNAISLPAGLSTFQPATEQAMQKEEIPHPERSSLITGIQQLKKDIANQFFNEAHQAYSDDLANKYIRLNALVEAVFEIITAYQVKQDVNTDKLRAIANLANVVNIICNDSKNIDSSNITQTTDDLRESLKAAKNQIQKSGSTLTKINEALQKDYELMPESSKNIERNSTSSLSRSQSSIS